MGSLIVVNRQTACSTTLITILTSIIAFTKSATSSQVKGDTQVVVLGTIMLGVGVTLGKEDYQILAQRPLDIFIGAIAQYTIMSLLVIGTAKVFNFSSRSTLGLVLVGAHPDGVSLNIMSFLAKGDAVFSVGMTTVSTILALVIAPLWMTYLVGQTVEMNSWGMFRFTLFMTLLPAVIGSVANILLCKEHWLEGVHAIMLAVTITTFAYIAGGVAAVRGHRFTEPIPAMVLAIAAHSTNGYIPGYYSGALTSMNTTKGRALIAEVGAQDVGLATGSSVKFFPGNAESAVTVAIAYVWYPIPRTILDNLFAWWGKRQQWADRCCQIIKGRLKKFQTVF